MNLKFKKFCIRFILLFFCVICVGKSKASDPHIPAHLAADFFSRTPIGSSFTTQLPTPPRAMHQLPIINTPARPYLRWLREGIKTAEGRVNGPMCQRMNVGDTILLKDSRRGQYIYGLIAFKRVYRTFAEMLMSEGVKNLLPFLPDGATIEDGVRVYRNFPGSKRVEEFGCVAIGITVSISNL